MEAVIWQFWSLTFLDPEVLEIITVSKILLDSRVGVQLNVTTNTRNIQDSRYQVVEKKKLKTKGTFRVGVLIKPTQIDARHRANYRLYRLNAGGLVNFFFNFLLKNFFEKYLWKYFWKMSLKNVFEKCLWIWIEVDQFAVIKSPGVLLFE